MDILCKTQKDSYAGQMVNRIGRYLYDNLDGAFDLKKSPNMVDVYVTVLYQLPIDKQIIGKGREYNDVHEKTIDINITTYQNKVRVDIIELDEMERTLGYDLYEPKKLENLADAKKLIFQRAVKRLSKAYKDYLFLF